MDKIMLKRYVFIIIILYFVILFALINITYGDTIEKTNNWKTCAEFSYMNISGTTTSQSLFGRLNLKKEDKKTKNFIKGNIQYNENYINKTYEKTINKWLLDYRYEKKITEKIFGFSSISYIDNEFSGYNYNIIIGPGFGYNVIKTKNHYLKGLLSIPYSYNRFAELENGNRSDLYSSGKITINYTWQISNNFTFKEIVDHSNSFENNKKYFINSETILKIKINTFLSLGLNYIVKYQNYLPSQNIRHTEKDFLILIIIDL